MSFLTVYSIVVVIHVICFVLMVAVDGTKGISRGFGIGYALCALTPFINFCTVVLSLIVVGVEAFERFNVSDWLDKPLFKE